MRLTSRALLEQVEQDAVERQRRQVALPAARRRVISSMKRAFGCSFGSRVVEAVDVLDQGQVRAAEALGEQVRAGVGAVRRDAAHAGRMLPERVRRVAVEDHARRGLDEERQQVAEDLRRDRHHAVRRKQRAEHVGVAEGVGDGQLGQHAGRQPEVDADREDVPAAHAAARADDQLVRRPAPRRAPRPAGRSSPCRRR